MITLNRLTMALVALNTTNFAVALQVSEAHSGSPSQRSAVQVQADLKPATPVIGSNTLNLTITDPAGKPIPGIKAKSSVGMTTMNMGTAHPIFQDMGKGHYKVVLGFLMAGPWRVNLKGNQIDLTFNFEAGNGKPWKAPAVSVAAVPKAPPVAGPAVAVQQQIVPPTSVGTQVLQPQPLVSGATKAPLGPAQSAQPMSGMDHHPMALPVLKESKVVIAKGDEDWSTATGFGKNAPMVAMMSEMMIGGSPMESMKMGAMTMKFDDQNFRGEVEGGGGGAMSGMEMGAMDSGKKFKVTVKISNGARTGDHPIQLTILDLKGKPVVGAHVKLSVAMTSMDMGTTTPAVKEVGKGVYSATVVFGMAGAWRVVAVINGGTKYSFDYQPK